MVSFDHVSKMAPTNRLTPSYQLMQIVSSYLEHREFNAIAALIVLVYTVGVSLVVLQLKKRIEVK